MVFITTAITLPLLATRLGRPQHRGHAQRYPEYPANQRRFNKPSFKTDKTDNFSLDRINIFAIIYLKIVYHALGSRNI
jgi:hypothetical protein